MSTTLPTDQIPLASTSTRLFPELYPVTAVNVGEDGANNNNNK